MIIAGVRPGGRACCLVRPEGCNLYWGGKRTQNHFGLGVVRGIPFDARRIQRRANSLRSDNARLNFWIRLRVSATPNGPTQIRLFVVSVLLAVRWLGIGQGIRRARIRPVEFLHANTFRSFLA